MLDLAPIQAAVLTYVAMTVGFIVAIGIAYLAMSMISKLIAEIKVALSDFPSSPDEFTDEDYAEMERQFTERYSGDR